MKIVVGIDQSYTDTGITVSLDGVVKSSNHCYTEKLKTNTEKRQQLRSQLKTVFDKVYDKQRQLDAEVIVVIERIRLRSQGFLNIDYIKSIGALNALIVDLASAYEFPVYSVDTRAWKTAIVGTSKGMSNPYGLDEKKYPTILWCIKHGYKDSIINYDVGKRKKGIIEKDGKRYTYNDNVADSICISLYGFVNKPKLEKEH